MAKMLLKIFVGVSCLSSNFAIAVNKNATDMSGAKLAEYLLFSTQRTKTLEQWIENIALDKKRKQEIKAYLVGHNMKETTLPEMAWSQGSNTLSMKVGSLKTTLNFERLYSSSELIVNNKVVKIDRGASFSEVANAIKKATGAESKTKKSALMNFMMPEAFAVEAAEGDYVGKVLNAGINATGIVYTALFYVTGIDQYQACTGDEHASHSSCIFKSNAKMIQMMAKMSFGNVNLEDVPGKISQFKCDGDKFSSINFDSRFVTASIGGEYNQKGEMDKINARYKWNSDETLNAACSYEISDGEFKGGTGFVTDRGGCDGVRDGVTRLGGWPEPFKKGEKIRTVANMSIPIKRLTDCCADKACKTEMAEIVANANATKPVPRSTTPVEKGSGVQ